MRIIVPMAGMGKRMRPHTLTVPKPLIPIAGKPIVHRLMEDIVTICQEPVEEIAYIIGPSFGKEVEKNLIHIAENLGAKGSIYYQEEALGTAHAIMCAAPSIDGKVVVAFADTLFKADFKLDSSAEGIIWVKQVEDPRQFGVVKLNDKGEITDFVEKPENFVSDLAIIGIYYFNDGAYLKNELQYLLDNDIKEKGEYQLTNALENMKAKGTKFVPGTVTEWLDCGNKAATVYTNQRYLEFIKDSELVSAKATVSNSVIIPPCFIAEGAQVSDSVIGPHVSVGSNTKISNSVVKNSIIQNHTVLKDVLAADSLIGSHVHLKGRTGDYNLGDYSAES